MAYENVPADPAETTEAPGSEPGRGVTHVEVTEDDAGTRLDNFLVRTLKGVPRTHVYRLLRKGEVRVNSKRAKPDQRVEAGDRIRLPPVRRPDTSAEGVTARPPSPSETAQVSDATRRLRSLESTESVAHELRFCRVVKDNPGNVHIAPARSFASASGPWGRNCDIYRELDQDCSSFDIRLHDGPRVCALQCAGTTRC